MAATPNPAPNPAPKAVEFELSDDSPAFVGVGLLAPEVCGTPVVGGRLVAVVWPVVEGPPLDGVTDSLVLAGSHIEEGGIVATALVTAKLKTDVASVSVHSQPPRP